MSFDFAEVQTLSLTPKSILVINGDGYPITDIALKELRDELEQHLGFKVPVLANCRVAVLEGTP